MSKKIVTLLIIILLVFIILMQTYIVKMIYDRYAIFDKDPLSYGANIYGIDYCECSTNKEGRVIIFNKTGSITKIRNSVSIYPNFDKNWTKRNINDIGK